MGTDKTTRILTLYRQLSKGEHINKAAFATEHNITERSFDRDIEDVRLFLSEIYSSEELLFDKQTDSYYLTVQAPPHIGEVEVMAFAKVLFGSGAFRKDEAEGLLAALYSAISKDKRNAVVERLAYDLSRYEAAHDKAILKTVWDLSACILREQKVNISYRQDDGEIITVHVSPVDVIFSERWFYLVAFDGEGDGGQSKRYRVDRIEAAEVADLRYSRRVKERYNNCITNINSVAEVLSNGGV